MEKNGSNKSDKTIQNSKKDHIKNEVVKAYVIGKNNIQKTMDTGRSNQLKDVFEGFYKTGDIIEPPYDLETLALMPDLSSILPQCVDAMKQNVEGFGYGLNPVTKDKEKYKEIEESAEEEKYRIDDFFDYISYDYSFEDLRKQLREDLEHTGNAYIEIIRTEKGDVAGFEYIRSPEMRLTKKDESYTEFEYKKYDKAKFEYVKVKAEKRFRRVVQIIGGNMVYFKEFGDPRELNAKTGKPVTEDEMLQARENDEKIIYATEIHHFRLHSTSSCYGVPRWIGVTLEILGSRATGEINYDFFDNKGIPPIAVLVSGGSLTESTVQRMEDYVNENVKGRGNFHKMLIMEAEGQGVSMPGVSEEKKAIRIQIEKLMQQDDALFMEYDDKNRKKQRGSFRLPPIYVGETEDYTLATASESKNVAEEQVFQPERNSFDFFINRKIFPEMEIKYWKFRTLGPSKHRAKEWSEITEKFGKSGMTARETRKIMQNFVDFQMEDYDGQEWLDIPINIINEFIKVGKLGGTPEGQEDGEENKMFKFLDSLLMMRKLLRESEKKFLDDNES